MYSVAESYQFNPIHISGTSSPVYSRLGERLKIDCIIQGDGTMYRNWKYTSGVRIRRRKGPAGRRSNAIMRYEYFSVSARRPRRRTYKSVTRIGVNRCKMRAYCNIFFDVTTS
ncbi:hypothetical protein EVAR_10155_1 [Eumeta japonica]|uniref:Uncharacterized protein n=1 Tax=Eumeta variegata TaxID=151549 RepID=A0A4C1UDQ2_EUMVA|nr:hypothetical protein EVAR_10155_1 [Eumeta japonica]